MARRGRFGRLPRAQPSLTNTIVAIQREMQQQRDSNIMDAWNKGGTFEGKKVTDEMVLAHWTERMKHVSKDDPLYDTYSETVDQLHYSIAESKISTKYAQGKVSAGAMARFYTNWAKKIPRNSEFHRVLERNAAQFMKSLKGRGGGGRGGGSRGLTALQAGQVKYEAPGQYLTEALTSVARDQLVIHGDETLDKVRLGVEENDPGAMIAIIDALNKNDKYRTEVMKTLHMMNPNIPANGQLTIGMYTQVLQTQANHLNKRAWDELAHGHVPTFNTLLKARDTTNGLLRQAAAWGATDQYYLARDDFMKIWTSPSQTPDAKLAAAQKYQTTLKGLESDAVKRGDTRQAVSLGSEVAGLSGDSSNAKPTLWEDFSTNSSSPSYQSEKGDVHTTAESVNALSEVAQAVKDKRMVYTYGKFSSGGQFTAESGGDSIGAIDVRYLTQDPNAYKAMPVAGAFGMEDVFVQGAPVMAVQQRPQAKNQYGYNVDVPLAEGEVAPDPQRVGTAYDTREGGALVRIYGIPQGDGTEMYTATPPWAIGVNEGFNQVTANGQDVVVINVPAGMKTPYGFNDPASVARTGVFPEGLVMSPYLAKAISTPEGIAQLSKFTNSAGEVMQYASGLYGVGSPKTLAAYGEILNYGEIARRQTGTGEDRYSQLPEIPGSMEAAQNAGTSAGVTGSTSGPAAGPNAGLPALTQWQNQYAADQGINPLAPLAGTGMPAIRLPMLDPLGGSIGRVINPNATSVLRTPAPPPGPLMTGFAGNAGRAGDDLTGWAALGPKPPPPPPISAKADGGKDDIIVRPPPPPILYPTTGPAAGPNAAPAKYAPPPPPPINYSHGK